MVWLPRQRLIGRRRWRRWSFVALAPQSSGYVMTNSYDSVAAASASDGESGLIAGWKTAAIMTSTARLLEF